MPENPDAKNSTEIQVSPARSRRVGPMENCPARLWELLADFEQWSKWMPGSTGDTKVQRIDNGDPGRGSQLQVATDPIPQYWTVTHWHPGQRMDLIQESPHTRIGYSFTVAADSDPGFARLTLMAEYQFSGFRRLFRGLWLHQERRRSDQMLENFTSYVKAFSY